MVLTIPPNTLADPPKTADVVIVGAGPAGATPARLLGGLFSVVLLDARFFPPLCCRITRAGLPSRKGKNSPAGKNAAAACWLRMVKRNGLLTG